MGQIGVSYGCGYWGNMMEVNWDTSDCSKVLDGNTGTAYGATVSFVNGRAQFGVMARLRFFDDGTPTGIDGYVKLYANVWGSPVQATGVIGWGYVDPDTGEMAIVQSFGNQHGDCAREMLLFRLPEYADWDYALFAEGTGTSAAMSSARAKIREIEFIDLWYSIPLPTAAFSASPRVGFAPLTVEFTDLSSYVEAWLWEFGDGDTSDVQHPTHTYENPGLYSVALTVANYKEQDTAIQEDYILVLPQLSRRRRAAWQDLERPLTF